LDLKLSVNKNIKYFNLFYKLQPYAKHAFSILLYENENLYKKENLSVKYFDEVWTERGLKVNGKTRDAVLKLPCNCMSTVALYETLSWLQPEED
jgi:hypothetical protein